MEVSINGWYMEVPPKSSIYRWILSYKLSIFGVLHYGNHHIFEASKLGNVGNPHAHQQQFTRRSLSSSNVSKSWEKILGKKKRPWVIIMIPIYGGFPKWGVPQNGWLMRENPSINEWFGGTPILGNLHLPIIWWLGVYSMFKHAFQIHFRSSQFSVWVLGVLSFAV